MSAPLLEVEALRAAFSTPIGQVEVIHGLSFTVEAGQTVAVVGESGSGKSVTALSILRLLTGAKISGRVFLRGRDLLEAPEPEMRKLRGCAIGMVFQEPMSSLNPVLNIGEQVKEAIILHRRLPKAELKARAIELLAQVGIAAPDRILRQYPHQLSGGMRQRVMIAIAVACDPPLLIADEPTTALDATVQAQILNLIRSLQSRSNSGVILITHDLGVVAELADRVVIMYAGRKVEEADAAGLFAHPRHPYTRGLLAARPKPSVGGEAPMARLAEIPGSAPAAGARLPGCPFAPRCAHAVAVCFEAEPPLQRGADGREIACHLFDVAKAA